MGQMSVGDFSGECPGALLIVNFFFFGGGVAIFHEGNVRGCRLNAE